MAPIESRTCARNSGRSTPWLSTFAIEDGEFFMLLGPSGCGKTTTLRMMAGLELPTSGEILIDGGEVSQKPASQRDIAFVFQMFALYPHMNVGKNITIPLLPKGFPRRRRQRKVAEIARILGHRRHPRPGPLAAYREAIGSASRWARDRARPQGVPDG